MTSVGHSNVRLGCLCEQPKSIAIVHKLFSDHSMLDRLNGLTLRASKVLLNWLALLAGMDLPASMQTGLRYLAKKRMDVSLRVSRVVMKQCLTSMPSLLHNAELPQPWGSEHRRGVHAGPIATAPSSV